MAADEKRWRELREHLGPELPPFFSVLQALRYQAAHHIRRLSLLVIGGVGVGAQGETRVGMTQHIS